MTEPLHYAEIYALLDALFPFEDAEAVDYLAANYGMDPRTAWQRVQEYRHEVEDEWDDLPDDEDIADE